MAHDVLRLSEIERKILYLLLMDAGAPVSKVARMAGCKDSTVQSGLRKFREAGLISRRIMVNVFRLGFSRHALYMTLSSEGQEQREQIARYLANSPVTSTVLEVGGEYDFFVSVVIENPMQLADFNRSLSDAFNNPFSRKDVSFTVRHSVFGEKCLVDDPKLFCECTYSVGTEKVEVDASDKRILFGITDPNFSTPCALARKLGLPQTTLEYRIKRLKERGVICGDLHEISGEKIGLTNYLILVGMKGLSGPVHEEFYEFVKKHPLVPHFSYEVGHWDYMLGVAAERSGQANELKELIHRKFGHHVSTVKSFPMFRAIKVCDYPFQAETATCLKASGL